MAGALAASKLHIKVGHVEAGLRSYDRRMPEEINRVVADHVSDYLFAPTEGSRGNLLREGIDEGKIMVTGNTIVDSVYQNLEIARRKVNVQEELGLGPKGYFLVTAHRAENVDDRSQVEGDPRRAGEDWAGVFTAGNISGPPKDEKDGPGVRLRI